MISSRCSLQLQLCRQLGSKQWQSLARWYLPHRKDERDVSKSTPMDLVTLLLNGATIHSILLIVRTGSQDWMQVFSVWVCGSQG